MSVNKSDGIRARVIFEARRAPSRLTGAPGRWLKAMVESLDSHSFDPYEFAYIFSNASPQVQRGFVKMVVVYMGILSQKYEAGLYQTREDQLIQEDGHTIYGAISFLDD